MSKKKVWVISLGGSVIVPDDVDVRFLKRFKNLIEELSKNNKFVIVCGGGITARKYISALKSLSGRYGKNLEKNLSLLGIASTRLNARLVSFIFGIERELPRDMEDVKTRCFKNDIVVCGALRYKEKETSDGTAAKLARFLNTDFINLTNVSGLYDKNPLKYKKARFIKRIGWREFYRMASKLKYKPGQHFVLDQSAAKIIMKYKIKTYLLGKELKNLQNLIEGRNFFGSVIEG